MSLRIAITRAEPDAHATAQRVKEMGGTPILAPLLRIERHPFDTNITGAQALLFTSTNGVLAFAEASTQRDVKVITVGNATADAALKAGFKHVRSANGDVGALAEVAGKVLDPSGGKLIHIAGEQTAGDLIGALTQAGFTAERRSAFEAKQVEQAPPALRERVDVVLFHSARAVDAYVRVGAPDSAQRIAACLGPRISGEALRLPWKKIVVAPAPREEALLHAAFAA